MPIASTYIFMQYAIVLLSSHASVLYLVAARPYQTPLLNNFVLANEVFYSSIIIATFFFSDAIHDHTIKFAAGVVLLTGVFLVMFVNFLVVVVYVVKGREGLKAEIREAKLKREERALMEGEVEESRR